VGDANCVTGFYCDGVGAGACQALLTPSQACQRAGQCVGDVCTNDICDQCTDGKKDGDETDVDCGGPTCGPCANGKACIANLDCQSIDCVSTTCVAASVIAVGAGSAGSAGAELHPSTLGNGTWSTPTALTAPSTSDLGVAFISAGAAPEAVAVMEETGGGADPQNQDVEYATWTQIGSFTPFAPIAAGVTARDVPAIAGTGGQGFVAFQGTDTNQYFALFSGTTWSPTAEAITTGGSYPTPAGIAAIGTNASVVYFANTAGSNDPTEQDRTTSWQAPTTLGTDSSFSATPAVVAMNGGTADLMTVYIRQSDGALTFNTRTSGVWSTSAQVPGALAPSSTTFGPNERVALAALPGGAAIVAWRDRTTNAIDYSLYSGTAWSAAPSVFPTAVVLSAAPAVAHGVAGAVAEIAYVDGSGAGWHARLVGSSWTTPVQVFPTGTLSHVALAASP
jgi:hypothetical protein